MRENEERMRNGICPLLSAAVRSIQLQLVDTAEIIGPRGVHKVIAGLMRPRVGNSSKAHRGVSGRQSSHSTDCRSRNQAGS